MKDLKNDASLEFSPRRVAHPKPRMGPREIAKKLLSPLQPSFKRSGAGKHRSPIKPRRLPQTSRYRAKRRANRLRFALKLRFLKWSKRTAWTLCIFIFLIAISFWAKFAVVYDLPPFVQQGPLQGVTLYVVYKSWWFGPPSFNLATYPIADPTDPETSLAMELQRYQDIITNPNEVVWTWTAPQKTNIHS